MTMIENTRPRASSRRAILAIAGAAAVVTPARAAEAEPLFDLLAEYRRAEEAHKVADEAYRTAASAARAAYPRRPLALYYKRRRQRDDGSFGIVLQEKTRESVERDWRNFAFLRTPAAIEQHQQALGAVDDYEARCRAVDEAFNVPALDAAEDAAMERWTDLMRQLEDTPPRTLRGVFLKLRLMTELCADVDDTMDRMVDSILQTEAAVLASVGR